ncbi:MAG: thiamine-phosphate kinase [Planctomycetota bacterium]|nr:thiamine-phosphate kinase [Planctomycetota bacterium]
MAWNEDNVHRWLAQQDWPKGLVGSRGHDAAVMLPLEGRLVTCADQCVEGVHFAAGAPWSAVGAKAVLRTLSDLAATAATPTAVTLTVRAPAHWSEAAVQGVILGARGAATSYGAELVAGDLAMAPGPAGLSVTAIGTLALDRHPVGRDRAVPGQRVVVTGSFGGSLESGRHLRIVPRLAEAGRLVASGATAMMDVSDGLALDLSRIARASGVAIEINAEAVPLHADAVGASERDGRSSLWHALHDGEDHELIACLPEAGVSDLSGQATEIGVVREGAGLWVSSASGREQWRHGAGGWIHGGGSAS